MKFISTRGRDNEQVSAATAIAKGIASDGGLYVPAAFPIVEKADILKLVDCDYAERAAFILSKLLDGDFSYSELLADCRNAYSTFEGDDPAPLVKIDDNVFILELFHGKTCAFKDMALSLLPILLAKSVKKTMSGKKCLVLVATSGDTGKAALEGFKDKDDIKIMVFYPSEGVSPMQQRQMQTQEGENVSVVAVDGNFDDCQTAVKKIFADKDIASELDNSGYVLSSANSINFGRLAPQVAYYFSAYCDLISSEQITFGDKVNFAVPTGNFGNILAAYYAKRMGLPINKLICASNSNNILTDFIDKGVYDLNREFIKTMSPSMDILVSSNLERLLFELAGRDYSLVAERMATLKEELSYKITADELSELQNLFYANYASEDETTETIYDFFEDYEYPLDPHSAVGMSVLNDYECDSNDDSPTVLVSTASPYKFSQDVLFAITGRRVLDPFAAMEILASETAMPVPDKLAKLKNKPVRFSKTVGRDDLAAEVVNFVK